MAEQIWLWKVFPVLQSSIPDSHSTREENILKLQKSALQMPKPERHSASRKEIISRFPANHFPDFLNIIPK